MEELMAGSAQELVALLAATDISVPPRTRGRRSRHVERYSVALLLATLADRELGYPLSLVHQDRPDYQLEMDGRRIGVEHTEAVPENEAHRSALREQGHGPDVHFINRASVDEPKRPREELIEEIEADDPGDGWAGDSVDWEWVKAMGHSVLKKLHAIAAPGFQHFDETQLVIYDNWPLPHVRREEAASALQSCLGKLGVFSIFSRVFVVDDHWVCVLEADGSRVLPVRDLWADS